MAYYNLAAEYEHCKDFDEAIEAFLKCQYFIKQNNSQDQEGFLEQIELNIAQVNQK